MSNSPVNDHDRPTVRVQFPDGERDYPAHWVDGYEIAGIGPGGTVQTPPRMVPDALPGFLFFQVLDGMWFAKRDVP